MMKNYVMTYQIIDKKSYITNCLTIMAENIYEAFEKTYQCLKQQKPNCIIITIKPNTAVIGGGGGR